MNILDMSDTTNLNDLPTDPVAGGGNGSGIAQNVVLQTTETGTTYNPTIESNNTSNAHDGGAQQSVSFAQQPGIDEQKAMNEFVTGIQQASASGATTLPSRDIPQSTVHFSDEQIKPNFVPQPEQVEQQDYIENSDTEQEILARRMKSGNSRDSLEILYDEFQIPIIIGLLYFIFQLPVVKSKFLTLLPSLFNSDGNPNLTGYIINSLFFGIIYYVISKSLTQLQNL
jgi:hypothetical protein